MKKQLLFSVLIVGTLGLLNAQQEVTFSVNMQGQTVNANGVHVAGNWQSEAGLGEDWQPNTATMNDNGDGTYSYTCTLPDGVYEYKFVNGNDWQEPGGTPENIPAICQVGGGNENRFFVVDGAPFGTPAIAFGGSAASDAGNLFKASRFTVDMPTSLTIDPTGVYLSGTFMDEFSGGGLIDWVDKIKLYDINAGDGAANYTGIVYYPEAVTGTFNYSFYNGATQELLPTACQGGSFPTRFFALEATSELTPKFCFASCDESCVTLPTFNATINIDMRYNCTFDVNSNDSVDVAGTFNNYQGGPAYLLSDADNDGIYSITLPLQAGEFQYKARIIRNGNFAGGWEGGSNTIVMLQSDTSLAARCFGLPSGECNPIPPASNITFRVDMTDETPASTIYLIGDFTTPPYQGGAIALTLVGPGIYETTVNGICPGKINYKYVNGPTTVASNEEAFPDSTDRDCVEPNGIGGFNRFHIRTGAEPVTLSYKFNTCEGGSSIGMESITASKAEVFPNPAQNIVNIRFADASSYKVDLLDLTGRVTYTVSNARNAVVLQRGDLSNGMYIVRLTSELGTSEVVKVQFN
jgi:hypothetical protein